MEFYNDGTTYLNGSVTVDDALTVTSIANALSDTDKFLVSDSGVLKYRTGAQVRSDIGAGTGSGTVTSVATGSGLTGGTITGSGTVSVDYGGSGLVNDAPGGTGNPDQDDLVLIGLDSSGSGETRSFALVDLPFTNNQGDITAVNAGTGINVATVLDGFPMAQKGEGSRAIGAALGVLSAGTVIPAVQPGMEWQTALWLGITTGAALQSGVRHWQNRGGSK